MARGEILPDGTLTGRDRPSAARSRQEPGRGPPVHAAGRGGPGPEGYVLAQGILPAAKGIADTGFLVAFATRQDQHHQWALELAERVTAPLLTCEAVLAETALHLQNTALTLALVREGLVDVAFDCRAQLAHLGALAERYADRRPDLADLCLIRLSELHPRHVVITVDREDFQVYRRNKREAIPIVCPPGA